MGTGSWVEEGGVDIYTVGDDSSDPSAVIFQFPLYDAKPENEHDEPKSYVEDTYNVYKCTFTGIKQVKD